MTISQFSISELFELIYKLLLFINNLHDFLIIKCIIKTTYFVINCNNNITSSKNILKLTLEPYNENIKINNFTNMDFNYETMIFKEKMKLWKCREKKLKK